MSGTVETVVTLSRKIPDDVREIDLDLDELDLTSAESKATYPKIKEYILDHYGLKVSSLFIAQVTIHPQPTDTGYVWIRDPTSCRVEFSR